LERSEFEILYGGSRGGGKTDAGIAWLLEETYNPKYRALVLRRNSDDLKDWVDRANQLYFKLVNPGIKSGNPPEFRFKSGAIIRTGHLKDEQAYTKYQGHEYHRILIEELTQIQEEKQYLRILSSCRSTVSELRPQVFLTTNPGGRGHFWVKTRFIDPAPPGTTIWKNGRSRVFIQATMDDNPTLMEKDPQYVANIEALKETDYETYMAWRFGDWDRFAGQVFGEFTRDTHVIKSVIPKESVADVMWMDWGYSEESAFATTLNSLQNLQTQDGQKYNQIVTYREWYGNLKSPREWARIIYNDCLKMNKHPKFCDSDPSMHSNQTGGNSIATTIENEWKKLNGGTNWCRIRKGSNSGRNSRVNRVGMMHEWMSINPATKMPYWVITENCVNFIRSVPMLVYDENLVEAYSTSGDDHMADQASYGLEKIKFVSVKPGSYSALKGEKKVYLGTDERGLPIVDPKMFFGTVS